MKYSLMLSFVLLMLLVWAGCVSQQAAAPEPKEPVREIANISLNKNAVSSGDESGYVPLAALDGDLKTRWSSAAADDAWFLVDLGYATLIKKIQIIWESPPGMQYKIQTSADAIKWTTFYLQNEGKGETEVLEGFKLTTRYIRFLGTTRSSSNYSFWEFEVYGEIIPEKEESFGKEKAARLNGLKDLMKLVNVEVAFKNPPPFVALKTDTPPVLDGEADDVWKDAYKYPLPFNQLNTKDQSLPNPADFSASWQVLFNGSMLYGIVYITDDIIDISLPTDYENDCVELFIYRGALEQIRALVGKPFVQKGSPITTAWNAAGTVCEYAVDFKENMEGKIINWNIAIADSEGKGRKLQAYPILGSNNSWTGVDLAELVFGDKKGLKTLMQTPTFKAGKIDNVKVDGDLAEWKNATFYPLGYNQLNGKDLVNPDPASLSGKFAVLYNGGKLYGALVRKDDITFTGSATAHENDCFELFLAMGTNFTQLRTIVGENKFDKGFMGLASEAVWNADGTVLEFYVELSAEPVTGKTFGFNAALTDNDGQGRKIQLYPVNGANESWQGIGLGEITFVK